MENLLVIGNETSNHIRIEILNYEREPNRDPYDSNWLSCYVSVSCDAWTGKKYPVSFLASDFEDFFAAVSKLNQSLKGEAKFSTMEEQLDFKMSGIGQGQIEVKGTALSRRAPDCMLQFEFDLDQTYMSKILSELNVITLAFPSR